MTSPISYEEEMYYLDIDDFTLSGKVVSTNMGVYPRLSFNYDTDSLKLITVYLSNSNRQLIEFKKVNDHWFRSERYTEGGYVFVFKQYVFDSVVYSVTYEDATNRLSALSVYNNKEIVTHHSFNKKYTPPEAFQLNIFSNKKLNCLTDRDYLYFDIESLVYLKRRFDNNGKIVNEQEYCYKMKTFKSFLLFELYSQYLDKLQCRE